MKFTEWLDTFIQEKELDTETPITVQGPSGPNYMTAQNVLDAIKQAPSHEQDAIKIMLIRIDFANASVLNYLKHLAKAIAL